MRSGKELILATKPFAKENRTISWFHLISGLLIFGLSETCTILFQNIFIKLIFSLLSALIMARLFIIYHDYLHRTILQRSFPAKIIMNAYGIFLLSPPSIWKRTHDHHHKNNSKLYSASIGSYPVMTKQKFMASSPKEKFEYLAVRHPVTIMFGYIFMFIYGLCIQSYIANPKLHKDSLTALIVHALIIITVLWLGGWVILLTTVLIPFFITLSLGSYLFYAQHNFPGAYFTSNDKWDYLTAATQSSSYMEMNPVMQWFTGNIGFHHIHHVNAHIPFYRLPEAMQKIPEFQNTMRTSLSPFEIVRCLKLKVWDAEKGKMTGV